MSDATNPEPPLTWLKAQIDVDAAQVEALEAALTAFGAVAVELADAADEPILEPPPGATPLWRRVRLTALFEAAVDETAVRLVVASVTAPGSLPPITFGVVRNEDWISRLREELAPLKFGNRLWVCPPTKACPDPDAIIVMMEPGLAFGTGTHPTTSLCLDWLDTHRVAGDSVLDYGCGSGILGIASLKLGARCVTAVDIDAQALSATRANARRNHCGDRLEAARPADLATSRRYDLLIANILSDTLVGLAPMLREHCRTGTTVLLGGILTTQAESVAAGYREWCDLDICAERDGWVLLTGTVIRS